MKPTQKSADRFNENRRGGRSAAARTREDERRETLVLLAIAVLFVANVVLYLCHHYGLTSLNDWTPRHEIAARVILE